jgi:Carboxypeptidase regulatory-like domain/TonB-dependent Receptor Plug Domain
MLHSTTWGVARRVWSMSLLATLALIFPLLAHAQENALISGTVTDNSGLPIVGASVVVASTGGNLTRTTQTNGDGAYVVSALPAGTFNVLVTAKGFKKFEARGVVLDVAQKERVDVTLTVGAVTEVIEVTGENVAQVETQSSDISSTITGKQVQQLELNGRNFTQLVTLAPGVINQTGQDEGLVGVAGSITYSINGGRTEYNNWEIDGGDNMDNGSNATLNVYPNLEAIAEFKVLTSNYGAQYGKNGSGTVEVETKSGTNQWHGSAFEYARNEDFNANSWFDNGNGIPRPAYKKHDFGYTFGGPVYIPHVYNESKQKTFFFWSQEWRREIVPGTPISQAVPSDAERSGNFNDVCPVYTGAAFNPSVYADCPYQPGTSGVPFPNNTLPGPFSSTANALLSLIPKANNMSGVAGTYQTGQAAGNPLPAYVANPSYFTHWREELIRLDHNLTDTERLTFRYIHDTWGTVNQGPLWGVYNNTFDNTNTSFVGPTTSFVARLTSNISPKLLNEFVASYTADHIFLTELSNVSLPSGGIDLVPLFPTAFEQANKIPAFSVGNTNGTVYGTNGFAVDTGYFPWKNANPTYTYRDIMTALLGNHTFFYGAYVAFAQKNQQSTEDIQGQLSFATANPNSTNNPFADLLLGQVAGYAQTSAQPYFYDRYKIFEPFFQDDWRITKKLTLNLGLRWSFYGRYQEKDFKEFNFDPFIFTTPTGPVYQDFSVAQTALLLPGINAFNGFQQCGAVTPTVPTIPIAETGCMKNKYVNPGPRIGFAYDPFGDGKWAIRGGYGIFFEHMNGNEANAESLQGNPSPLVLNGAVSNINGYANVGAGTQAAPAPFSATSIPSQVQWPYMQQWNFGVQHELPAHVVMSLAYVGSKGTHLTRIFELNQLQPVPASENPFLASGAQITAADCSNFAAGPTGLPTSATLANGTVITGQPVVNLFVACGNSGAADYYRPYQGISSVTRIENSANSIYNSLQATARRTIGDLTLSAAYTWSHSIDDSSDRYDAGCPDTYDLPSCRASSNFDIRQSLSVSYVYALPFFRHDTGLVHTLLGGWQWSGITVAQTGAPFSVANGTQYTDNAGVGNATISNSGGVVSFPDVVGNPNSVPSGVQNLFQQQHIFGVLKYNPTAFDIPVGLTFGDAARNMLRMPGRLNFDMGLFKRFEFKERYAFEFRWETFNTFNHTQLDAFGNTNNPGGAGGAGGNVAMGCSPVAAYQAGLDPTCGGFLVLNGAHNPRIMQLGLRFQF